VGASIRNTTFVFVGLVAAGCGSSASATTGDDQNVTSGVDPTHPVTGQDGQDMSVADCKKFAGDLGDPSKNAAILFPTPHSTSEFQPTVVGRLRAGGSVTIVFALNRLPGCRSFHDGNPFWATRLGAWFGDDAATKPPADAQLIGELNPNDDPRAHGGTPGAPPGTITVTPDFHTVFTYPYKIAAIPHKKKLVLYFHNENPGGVSAPCDTFDSRLGANYVFDIQE
jgi:hypothetical protein